MPTYYALHRNVMLENTTQWRKNNKQQYNDYQRIYVAKVRLWNKVVKEFQNILLDGYY
jgi:hypothetical protein